MFARMGERVEDKIEDVLVGETVENVFAFAAARHETLGAKYAQALRDSRDLFAFGVGDFGDASLALCEQGHEAKARRIAESAENTGGTIHRLFADGRRDIAEPVAFSGAGGFEFGERGHAMVVTLEQLFKCLV